MKKSDRDKIGRYLFFETIRTVDKGPWTVDEGNRMSKDGEEAG